MKYMLKVAHNIPDGRFMLIHGTKDDNVHIQHSMKLSRELVENDIVFRQQVSLSSLTAHCTLQTRIIPDNSINMNTSDLS